MHWVQHPRCRSQSFVYCSGVQGKIDLSGSVTSTAVSIPGCWVSGSTEVLCRQCQRRNVPINVPGNSPHGKGCSLLAPWFLLWLCHKSAVLTHGQLGGHQVPEVLPCRAASQWVRPFWTRIIPAWDENLVCYWTSWHSSLPNSTAWLGLSEEQYSLVGSQPLLSVFNHQQTCQVLYSVLTCGSLVMLLSNQYWALVSKPKILPLPLVL